MSIGAVDYLSGIYYFVSLETYDASIRQSISGSEAAVSGLISTTPAIDRAIAEFQETNSFSQLEADMENNEQAAIELGK
jgi:F0F1-type ATP synthase alpha subunit